MPQWFTDIASVASIVGTAVSIVLLVTVRNIERRFLFRARFPELLKALQKHAKDLNEHMSNFEATTEAIETVLVVCDATLDNLQTKLGGDQRKQIRLLQARIRDRPRPLTKERTFELYRMLQATIEAATHFDRDLKWSAQ